MNFVNTLALVCLAVGRGAYAATFIDNCADEPCVHGSCVGDATSYTCTCYAGFVGANCNVTVGPYSRYLLPRYGTRGQQPGRYLHSRRRLRLRRQPPR
ncbi:hypothetical protein DIPPA_24057 [Diplonema papillatum]|nr:hypothetical protein DIPPA_24057 [Diplonema papillatum]